MKVGYTRVSKQEQNEALQRDALKEAGCEKYFSDRITGSKFERKGLEGLLAFVRPGDTVIVLVNEVKSEQVFGPRVVLAHFR